MSPTQRALAALRKEGWQVAVVEHFNSYVKIRQDLWGFADLLAVRGSSGPLVESGLTAATLDGSREPAYEPQFSRGTLAVQVTSADHAAEHREKVAAEPRARVCLAAGWAVEVWGVSTRREEAKDCKACCGTGLDPATYAFNDPRRCKECRGKGVGKRPLTKRVCIRRWRMDARGAWSELSTPPLAPRSTSAPGPSAHP